MDLKQVEEVLQSEKSAFQAETKEAYVLLTEKLSLPPKIDECVVFVGTSPLKKYVDASLKGLSSHKAVFIVGKGPGLAKAVTVAEQVKQNSNGRLVQLNKGALHSSLINPALRPAASRKNVSVFFDDGISASSEEQQQQDAIREIRGYKVFKTPSMSVMLIAGEAPSVPGWTRQVVEHKQ